LRVIGIDGLPEFLLPFLFSALRGIRSRVPPESISRFPLRLRPLRGFHLTEILVNSLVVLLACPWPQCQCWRQWLVRIQNLIPLRVHVVNLRNIVRIKRGLLAALSCARLRCLNGAVRFEPRVGLARTRVYLWLAIIPSHQIFQRSLFAGHTLFLWRIV